MKKEECIALLERYADYDGMGIPNLDGCKEAMKTAAEFLKQPSMTKDPEKYSIETYPIEDEEMLNRCISSIEEAKENRYAYKETDDDTSYDREISFLKSLRPQQKREWSKEDHEYILARIKEYLKDNDCPTKWIDLLHDIFCFPYFKQKPVFKKGDTVLWDGEEYNIFGIDGKNYNVGEEFVIPIYRQNEFRLKPVEAIEFNEFEKQVSHIIASAMNRECDYNEGFVKHTSSTLLEYAKRELKQAEWSEEDDANIDYLIDYFNNIHKGITTGKDYFPPSLACQFVNWLYRLKSLFPQPKQESNEEKIMNFFDAIGDCGFSQSDILQLKTIWKECGLSCPKPQWKPSEEQMEWLETAFRLSADKPEIHRIIESLLIDLKKLM